jgi:hypothetical protein
MTFGNKEIRSKRNRRALKRKALRDNDVRDSAFSHQMELPFQGN